MRNTIDAPETLKVLASQIREARVDHAAFEVLLRPCEMSRCKATCCYDGVSVSTEEGVYLEKLVRGSLLSGGGIFAGLDLEAIIVNGQHQGGKKTGIRPAGVGELADDFPVHFPKTRCVFLDQQGFCGLQKLAMEQELYHFLK